MKVVQAQQTNHWLNSKGKLACQHPTLQTLVGPFGETGQMPRIHGPNEQILKSHVKLPFLKSLAISVSVSLSIAQ